MAGDKGHPTDLQLSHWIEAGKPLAKADGNGLTFTLSAAGVAGWILRCRHGGRRRQLTIGRYPDVGLAEARGIATLKRAEVQQGRNPAAEKQKAKATAARDWTERDLAKDYRAKKLAAGFVGMTAWLGDAGRLLFVPVAAVVLVAVAAVRRVVRQRRAWRVDREIDLEAWRTAKGKVALH